MRRPTPRTACTTTEASSSRGLHPPAFLSYQRCMRDEGYGWYSVDQERLLARQVPTPPVFLYERVSGGVVPALAVTLVNCPPDSPPGLTYQGKIYTRPVHAYTPSPYELPRGARLGAEEHLPRLMSQRAWMSVDFLLDVLTLDTDPLPLDQVGAEQLVIRLKKSLVLQPKNYDPAPYARTARMLLQVSPPYLKLVKGLVPEEDVGALMLEVGFALVRRATPAFASANLALLHCMDCGRRNVQQALYLLQMERAGQPVRPPGRFGSTLTDQLLSLRQLLYPRAESSSAAPPPLLAPTAKKGRGRG